MKFKNMKIEINEEQPLDEVVRELDRLGYRSNEDHEFGDKAIIVINGAFFGWWSHENWTIPLTNLAELKEMK